MNAGKLRHRVTLEQLIAQTNSFGGVTYVDGSDLTLNGNDTLAEGVFIGPVTVWANVEPLNGRERLDAQQINARTTHKVTIRYIAGLSPSFRVKYGTRIFRIDSITNAEERNIWLELSCTETGVDQP